MSNTSSKSFQIPKEVVWQAWLKVKENKGAPGVDGVSLDKFESDLRNELYKIWNRMSSGTYFPAPVKAVPIPKADGGTRWLGVPTVGDRVAQTVAALLLEPRMEAIFHSIPIPMGSGGVAALTRRWPCAGNGAGGEPG